MADAARASQGIDALRLPTVTHEEATVVLLKPASLSTPNAYLRISGTSPGPYAGLTPPEKDLFRRVIEAFPPQRVMWDSNFPSSREGDYRRSRTTFQQ